MAIEQCVSNCSESLNERLIAHGVGHGAALLVQIEDVCCGEQGKMPGHHRKVDRAAFSDLGDGAPAPTLGDTRQHRQTCGVRKSLEQPRIEQLVKRADAACGLLGRSWPRGNIIFAYLRHYASIGHCRVVVKGPCCSVVVDVMVARCARIIPQFRQKGAARLAFVQSCCMV